MLRSLTIWTRNVCSAVILAFGIHQCSAQCITAYTDQSFDGDTLVATHTLIDNFTDLGSQCAPSNWGGFTHSYTTSVSLTSPTGRYNSSVAFGGQGAGSSPGYGTASVGLSVFI